MLWLLAIPIVFTWLFLFALCRAAARPAPRPEASSFDDQIVTAWGDRVINRRNGGRFTRSGAGSAANSAACANRAEP